MACEPVVEQRTERGRVGILVYCLTIAIGLVRKPVQHLALAIRDCIHRVCQIVVHKQSERLVMVLIRTQQ